MAAAAAPHPATLLCHFIHSCSLPLFVKVFVELLVKACIELERQQKEIELQAEKERIKERTVKEREKNIASKKAVAADVELKNAKNDNITKKDSPHDHGHVEKERERERERKRERLTEM